MVGAYSVLTTKVIRENTRKRFTEVAQAKAEAENLLERNEELDQQQMCIRDRHWRERKMVKNNLTPEQKEFAQQIGDAFDQDKGIWYNKSC